MIFFSDNKQPSRYLFGIAENFPDELTVKTAFCASHVRYICGHDSNPVAQRLCSSEIVVYGDNNSNTRLTIVLL